MIEARSLVRSFGPVRALDGASLTALPGEVHAILGENGAGKTTLANLLCGILRPDAGEILLGGRPVQVDSPRTALRLGIGMVHQHFTLVPRMTVLENVMLGFREEARGMGWPARRVRDRLEALMEETGLRVDPDLPVERLGVGGRQRVEILKALHRDPGILVLDEPTAVLAPPEVERLFEVLRGLAKGGRSILLIAHKLDEVLAVAQRVTVLRGGRTVLAAPRSEVDAGRLARAMVGRSPSPPARSGGAVPGEVVARLEGVRVAPSPGEAGLSEVSLELRRGEIVGVAGVEGNGQRSLALVLAGREAPVAGRVDLPPRVGLVPHDRREEGLVLDFDLAENVALALHDDPGWRWGPALRWGAIRAEAEGVIRRYDVRAPGVGVAARTLSGGNQQKLVVGRELDRDPELLVVENPTRGLDVGAAEALHRELLRRREGRAIVLLSTDLDEILALADRILVMVRGRLSEVPPEDRSREGVGARMLAAEGGA